MDDIQTSVRATASDIVEKVRQMRADCLVMGLAAGNNGIHLGGSCSAAEIVAALYFGVMRFNPDNPHHPLRDRFIFSKGHGVPIQYAAFHQMGIVGEDELRSFKQAGSRLTGHPSWGRVDGVDFSSGSLGQGLSLGVGSCLALRYQGNTASRVFVLLGDGECDEGSVWEAAMSASHYGLNNLVAIVDANELQYDGATSCVLDLGNLGAKWRAFGWDVAEVDGHNVEALLDAFNCSGLDVPRVVIAKTIKGKGFSFSEGVAAWHHARLTRELYDKGMSELGFSEEEASARVDL